MKLKVIITGTTGMVGEGVLHVCLKSDKVESILVINRKSCGYVSSKLTEIIHRDFFDITRIKEKLTGYDACFFCLGVSSIGMKEVDFYKQTYVLTLYLATIFAYQNPNMAFCYISGSGTDATESSNIMWKRVKGKTENNLLKLPFRAVYNFRPGFLKPIRKMKHTHTFYKFIGWLYPVIKLFFPKFCCTLTELGLAMINAVQNMEPTATIEVKEIRGLAKKAQIQ